jgi:nucleotide-binding universal stress UspA family protein
LIDETNFMKRFQNILLYAGMEQNEAAVNRAVNLAMENRAPLTFMDVVKPIPRALGMLTDVVETEEMQRLLVQDHREKLLAVASDYVGTGVEIDVVVSCGDPATEIVRQVLEKKHDLVVKAVNGDTRGERIFGSISRSLLRLCPCPVWLLKPEIHGQFDVVLAAVDMEDQDPVHVELNREILELGHAVAAREDAKLHIVSVWDLWMEHALRRRAGDEEIDAALAAHKETIRKRLDAFLEPFRATHEAPEVHLRRGSPSSIVRSVADDIEADLLVMGTVCRTGAAGFLIGNTAETVLNHITCSILALKPEGFVSPVEFASQAG